MANQLYYIAATDADGGDKSLLAVAADPQGAFQAWEDYYYPDAEEWREDDCEPHDYLTELTLTDAYEHRDTDLRVFLADLDLAVAGALGWSEKLKVVAYIPEAR